MASRAMILIAEVPWRSIIINVENSAINLALEEGDGAKRA